MIAGQYTFRGKNQTGDGNLGMTRGSIAPWADPPPGPAAYITLVPKHRRAHTAPATPSDAGLAPWTSVSLRGHANPNVASTLTRVSNGAAPAPLAESQHHGPTAISQPYNNTSTAANDRDSWQVRNKGGNRGTYAPWDTRSHYKGPAQSGPGGPGWTYAERGAADITSSSTATVNMESWHNRLPASGPLLGLRSPNATLRVAPSNPNLLASSTGKLFTNLDADFNKTSTAANDRASWNHRQGITAETTRRLAASGQPYLSNTDSRQGAVYATNYQKFTKPDITRWSTASVNKESWEYRVTQTFPDHLTFRTARV